MPLHSLRCVHPKLKAQIQVGICALSGDIVCGVVGTVTQLDTTTIKVP